MAADGLCECGCGEPTPIAQRSYGRQGIRKGDPLRYLVGHQMHPHRNRAEPNPSGLCKCGCGEKAPIAPYSRENRGWVQGCAVNFIPGHHLRKSFAEYAKDESTGCWIWLRASSRGYGIVPTKRTHKPAHRVIYERIKGAIPAGHDLHHECGNKLCVNPDHLTPVTKQRHSAVEAGQGTYRRWPIEEQMKALELKGTMSARAAALANGWDRNAVLRLWKRGHVK